MTTEHPDLLLQQHAIKQIARGSRQFADDKAMEAYWSALEEGKSAEEAEAIFSETYYKIVRNGKETVLPV